MPQVTRAAVPVLARPVGREDHLLHLFVFLLAGLGPGPEADLPGHDHGLDVVSLEPEAVDDVAGGQVNVHGVAPAHHDPVRGVVVLPGHQVQFARLGRLTGRDDQEPDNGSGDQDHRRQGPADARAARLILAAGPASISASTTAFISLGVFLLGHDIVQDRGLVPGPR